MRQHLLGSGLILPLLVGLLLASTGCPGEPKITVQLCGDWTVPGNLDAVRVSTLSNDRSEETYAGVFELLQCSASGDATIRSLPTDLAFTAPEAPLWIIVQGLHEGAEVMRTEVRVGKPLSGDLRVPVRFTLSCGSVECPLGQTCVDGECVVVPFVEDEPMSCEGFGSTLPTQDATGSDTVAAPDAAIDTSGDSGSAIEAGPSGPCAPPTL